MACVLVLGSWFWRESRGVTHTAQRCSGRGDTILLKVWCSELSVFAFPRVLDERCEVLLPNYTRCALEFREKETGDFSQENKIATVSRGNPAVT